MKLLFLSKLGKSGEVGNKKALPLPAKLQTTKLQSSKIGDSFCKEISKKIQSPPAPAPAPAKAEKEGFFSKLLGGVTNAAKAVGNVVGSAAKAVGNAVVGAAKAVGNVVLEASSPILYGGLKALSAIQEALGVEPKGRPLSPKDIEMLRSVYGDSIDYSKVVIKEGKAGLISKFNSRSFVVGNTIYVPSGKELSDSTLVHEMMHVWQYQNGGTGYMGKAVAAQLWGPADPNDGSRGYFYEDDVIAGKPFEKLNPEQQAELIEDAFRKKFLPPTNPPGSFVINGVDCTDYVLRGLEMIKARQGAS